MRRLRLLVLVGVRRPMVVFNESSRGKEGRETELTTFPHSPTMMRGRDLILLMRNPAAMLTIIPERTRGMKRIAVWIGLMRRTCW